MPNVTRTAGTRAVSRTAPTGGVVSSLQVIKLKAAPLQANGKTKPLTFDLPPDAIGFSVHVRGSPSVSYVISDVTDASGQALVRSSSATPTADAMLLDRDERASPNRAMLGESPGTAALLVPNNPKVTLKPGKGFKLQVAGWKTDGKSYLPANGPVDVTVTVKRAPGKPVAGRINLHLFFSGSGGFTKASAQQSEAIRRGLDQVRTTYAKAGVTIGTVTFDDMPSMPKRPASFAAMQKSFDANRYADGIGVFFTDTVLDGASIAGASAGLPGPAVAAGVPRSGVVMTTQAMAMTSNQAVVGESMGCTLAHELGHYLSLFHTRDEFLKMDDPLPDTKNDMGNVMYPFDLRGAPQFSKQQAAVMLRHPAVQITRVAK